LFRADDVISDLPRCIRPKVAQRDEFGGFRLGDPTRITGIIKGIQRIRALRL
jgi:hypothetical protein